MKQYLFLFLLFLVFTTNSAQSIEEELKSSNTHEALLELFNKNKLDTLQAKKIAQYIIEKSKLEKDRLKVAKGYIRLSQISETSIALKYLDTSIAYTINNTVKDFPAESYLQKSALLFGNDAFEESLKNAILAHNSAETKKNIDQQITSLHQINKINEMWGDFRKALDTEFLTYNLLLENKNNQLFSEHYLYSLEGIGKCYSKLNVGDSALIYFKKGLTEAIKKKDTSTYYAFVSRTGMALFVQKKYRAAIDSLHKGDRNRLLYNNSYLPYYYYYVGSSFLELNEKEKGIKYLLKVDSIYEAKQALSPELPETYDKLVTYYKENNNTTKQLEYLYKLVAIERTIGSKRAKISKKIESDYIIPKLLKDKEEIIENLTKRNKDTKNLNWWILVFLGISFIAMFYYIKRQQKFKKRFKHLIKTEENIKSSKTNIEGTNNGISISIIQEILAQLNQFEEQQKFLSQNLSLVKMSKDFKTNSTYLSKVINLKKDKNFSQYINDLRIDYFIQEIKVSEKFKKYTIKAIANECGFKSAESFSKAFYKKHGIYPSYFLNQLKNKKK